MPPACRAAIPDYPEAFAGWNYVASLGSFVGGFSVLIFLYVAYRTFTSASDAGG